MSKAKIAVMFPEAMKPKKLSEIKDADEKRWKIEGAARTLKRLPEIKREIAQIKEDNPLFEAAKALLAIEVADAKTGLKI